jgi:hypothetical protein
MVFWAALSVTLAAGPAWGARSIVAMDSGDEAYSSIPLSEPTSYAIQVKLLLKKAGVKMPLDAALEDQQGYDDLLQLLRSDSSDSIRAEAGSLLMRHPMLVPASLEMLIALFERIPASRAWERNHLPRAWLELRESGQSLLLTSPERMAALLHTSPIEDTAIIEGRRDGILGLHGDIAAQRRLRDALLKCIADALEFVDCLESAPVRGLGTLELALERWDPATPGQRAALIRWIEPTYPVREFALESVRGVSDRSLRSALIDVALPLLGPDGLERVLEESLQLAVLAGGGVKSTRDDRGFPLSCSESIPMLDDMSPHLDRLHPGRQVKLADQMISAAIESPDPLRACLLQMAATYDPQRKHLVQAEFASRRESDGNPSVEALAGLFAAQVADDWLVQPVILHGTAEKWMLVMQEMSDEQWERLIDALLVRIENFPTVVAEYVALMPHKVERGEAPEPPPLLKAELWGHETALQRMRSLAPERMPSLAQRFEAQDTDTGRMLALEIWSGAKEDPASLPHRQRLAEALLTALNPNLRGFGAEKLAKIKTEGPQ